MKFCCNHIFCLLISARTGFSAEEIAFLHNQHTKDKLKLNWSEKEKENFPADHDPDHEAEPIRKHERKLVLILLH